ncbi:MAG TPA: hypothetical protein VFJ20_10190 [Gemmatimonadaceae bacterium]|nr:hypothetical protein [Gemmatimonadaceae bacterium]
MDFLHRSSLTSVPRCPWLFRVAGASVVSVSLMLSPIGLARASERTPPNGGVIASIAGMPLSRVVAPASLFEALAAIHKHVPAYSRQTGLACSSCHYQFPQLTPFGRLFKLNGYTLTGLQTIGQPGDSAGKESLKLSPIPGIAAMLVSSVTQTSKALPGTQNTTANFPDQFSLFAAGALTPKIGAFTQFTYAAADGSFGIDNIDIRFADHGTLADHDWIYGLTLHNNPTVQDVWNTVPAWSYPFMASSTAPSSIASTLIDGGLGQQVLGLGAYSLYNSMLYTEFTVYRSAPQGFAMPLDSTAENTTSGVIPYWRVALQHESPSTSLMLGTFGFDAHLFPTGISGPRDHFSDVAVDAQVEQRQGKATWIGRASYIHESRQLIATQQAGGAESIDQTLWTGRASLAYLPNMRYSFTLGYFQTNGTADAALYAPGDVFGSRTGSPNTGGAIGEINYNAWQNTRVGLQYVAYNKFNGASTAYDVPGGRAASDNNNLYLYMWIAF